MTKHSQNRNYMKDEIRPSEPCPCDSGMKYKDCCKKKKFYWQRNKKGEISRCIPMSNEVIETLKETEQHFKDIFERKPYPSDPVLVEKYLYSDRDLSREMINAMREAGVREEIIYSYEKTGLLIGRDTLDVTPTKDIEDWNNAIDEYFELQKKPREKDDTTKAIESFINEYKKCIIAFGYLLEYGFDKAKKSTPCGSKYMSPELYSFICATKSFKTLKSIHFLLEKEAGFDALALTRSIYENYLHIVFITAYPEKICDLVDAVLGLKYETHEYKKSQNGKIDRRVILEKETGRAFEGHISTYRMASASMIQSDIELFDYTYEFLSEYLHPSIGTVQDIFNEDGALDPNTAGHELEAYAYALIFSCFILDELRLLSIVKNKVANDMLTVIRRIRSKAIDLIDNHLNKGNKSHYFNLLSQRIKVLGSRNRG